MVVISERNEWKLTACRLAVSGVKRLFSEIIRNAFQRMMQESSWEPSLRPSKALAENSDEIRKIVRSHRALNPRAFGSVASGKDGESRDLDILVYPAPEMTLLDIGAIRHELRQLLGIHVDVLTPKALPSKFRERVLAEAVPLCPEVNRGLSIISIIF